MQQVLDDAQKYWFYNQENVIRKEKIEVYHHTLYKQVYGKVKTGSLKYMAPNKFVLLVLTPSINFDYYLDWAYELSSVMGISGDQMHKWEQEIVGLYYKVK